MVADWETFYLVAGGAAAALTGLIFVAVTLHERGIIRSPLHRDRAWASLALLGTLLVFSLAAVVPGISMRLFGLGLLPFAAYWAYRTIWASKTLGPGMRGLERPRHVYWQVEWVWWIGWVLVLVVGALMLVAESAVGLPVVAFAVLNMFCFALWSAWVLISEVSE